MALPSDHVAQFGGVPRAHIRCPNLGKPSRYEAEHFCDAVVVTRHALFFRTLTFSNIHTEQRQFWAAPSRAKATPRTLTALRHSGSELPAVLLEFNSICPLK